MILCTLPPQHWCQAHSAISTLRIFAPGCSLPDSQKRVTFLSGTGSLTHVASWSVQNKSKALLSHQIRDVWRTLLSLGQVQVSGRQLFLWRNKSHSGCTRKNRHLTATLLQWGAQWYQCPLLNVQHPCSQRAGKHNSRMKLWKIGNNIDLCINSWDQLGFRFVWTKWTKWTKW